MSSQPPQDYPPQNVQPPFSPPLGEPYAYSGPDRASPEPTRAFPQQPESRVPHDAPQQPYSSAHTPPPKRRNINKIALIVLGSIVGFLLLLGIGIAATRGSSASTTATPSAIASATLASTPVAAIAPSPTVVPPSPTPPVAVIIVPSPSPTVAVSPTALSSAAAPSVAAAAQVVTVTDPGMINVRAMPSTSSDIVTQMSQGDDADVLEPSVPDTAGGPTWIHISYKGQRGYIRSDIIGAPHATGVTPPTATAASATTAGVTAASSPSTKAPLPVPTLAATKAGGMPTVAPTATKAAGMPTVTIVVTPKR